MLHTCWVAVAVLQLLDVHALQKHGLLLEAAVNVPPPHAHMHACVPAFTFTPHACVHAFSFSNPHNLVHCRSISCCAWQQPTFAPSRACMHAFTHPCAEHTCALQKHSSLAVASSKHTSIACWHECSDATFHPSYLLSRRSVAQLARV